MFSFPQKASDKVGCSDRSFSARQLVQPGQQHCKAAAHTVLVSAGPCRIDHALCFAMGARGRYPFALPLCCCGCQVAFLSSNIIASHASVVDQQLADSNVLCSLHLCLASLAAHEYSSQLQPPSPSSTEVSHFRTAEQRDSTTVEWLDAACCLPEHAYHDHSCHNQLSADMLFPNLGRTDAPQHGPAQVCSPSLALPRARHADTQHIEDRMTDLQHGQWPVPIHNYAIPCTAIIFCTPLSVHGLCRSAAMSSI